MAGIFNFPFSSAFAFLAQLLQSWLTFYDPARLLHSWNFQARIQERVAISFPRGSCNPGIKPAFPMSPALQVNSAVCVLVHLNPCERFFLLLFFAVVVVFCIFFFFLF